jgi:maltose alpha-D-glucosyltransferase/alpha-amylase
MKMITDESDWYKSGIFYELRVRSFHDSNGDGIGDFRGLTEKLPYLQDLGVTTLWLLPFYPSPMKDDGYDIADYTGVDPDCGTLEDFKTFLGEAHRRGLRVITELVLNHTSDQHAWFQRARRDKADGPWRDYYVWNDSPDKFKDARIIFKDFETSNWAWDPVAKAYYWHRFYSHQPDLNFDNPAVKKAMFEVVDFWLGMGVDGLRLDAVPYLYERDGTSCENLPETHAFLKELRKHVDDHFPHRMLLAEANQWPEDAAAYFGAGDECQMAFHFPIMPRIFMSLHMEDRFPIVDILAQTPAIAENCQWAIFLRNHDELTLEMVTEEERDYMYRMYASDPKARINLGIRHRLAPLLGKDRKRMELMNGLLFSLPGTPVIYYGDEIGMGDNIYLGDRNGVRTPMQWSSDRNAGFSRANPQRLILPIVIDPDYHYETINVEAQQNNPYSLLWWMKRLIALRKQYKALGQGSIEFLMPKNGKVLAYFRQHEGSTVLVVANLSRYAQYIEMDLSRFKGMVPLELFGRTEFPKVGELPYLLTLGPHDFFWFSLETVTTPSLAAENAALPEWTVQGDWKNTLESEDRIVLERMLLSALYKRRWFGGKARKIKQVRVYDTIRIPAPPQDIVLALLTVEYIDGASEAYSWPFTFWTDEAVPPDLKAQPLAALARLTVVGDRKSVTGILYDAFYDLRLSQVLLESMERSRTFEGQQGTLSVVPGASFAALRGPAEPPLVPKVLKAEQSNTSVLYGDRLILKLFRRLEAGLNPDLEIGNFLTEKGFANAPAVAGSLIYRTTKGAQAALAILQGFIPNQGTAWDYSLGEIQRYFELALTRQGDQAIAPVSTQSYLALTKEKVPPLAQELFGTYLAAARLMGQRTAELHNALSRGPDNPDFQPEPFSSHYQWAIYQSMRAAASRSLELLRDRFSMLPDNVKPAAKKVLDLESVIQKNFRAVTSHGITALRLRCHGDYHLGQVLYTGKDFIIIDFEGEPARPLSERRIKRSPLRDIAGMLRSFHYAACTAHSSRTAGPVARPEDEKAISRWALFWEQWVSASFLDAYLKTAAPGGYLPTTSEDMQILLNSFLMEKALYELSYELNNRPDWVYIPLQGILHLLGAEGA